jgi:large-conductance mechanosensitive channel
MVNVIKCNNSHPEGPQNETSIINFLEKNKMSNQVALFAMAILVGTMLSQFFTALMRDIVLPLMSPLASAQGGVAQLVVPIGSVKLNVGDLIVQTLNLLLSLALLGMVMPYLTAYVPIAGRGR